MTPPLISIIITTYNYAHIVATAIDSAVAQDYPNIEVLVIDNASTDETATLMERYAQEPRVRYVRNAENIGMVPNHNEGLRQSRGTYVSFLSADDFLMPTFVKMSYAFLQANPDIDVLYASTYFVDEGGHYTGVRQMMGQPLTAYAGGRNEFAGLLSEGCYMCFPTMLMKRELYERFGELDEGIKAADYEIVVRWAAEGVRFAYTPEPMAAVRLHSAQQSSVENYAAGAGDVRELVQLIDKFVTPQHEAKIAGREGLISWHLSSLHQRALDNGYGADSIEVLESSVTRALKLLADVRVRNRTTRPAPKITYLVVVGPYLTTLEETLLSLVAQDVREWEAIVLHPGGTALQPLCSITDPKGRIRAASMTVPLGTAGMLNVGLRIAAGNVFHVLRAGATLRADHTTMLLHAFGSRGVDVARFPLHLSLERIVGNSLASREQVAIVNNAYPEPSDPDALLIAPMSAYEGVAFSALVLDAVGIYSDQIPVFNDWEHLLRLRKTSHLELVESPVTLHGLITAPDGYSNDGNLVAVAAAIHAAYPDVSAEVTALRAQYLSSLRLMLAGGPGAAASAEGLLDVHRAVSGVDLVTSIAFA